MVGRGPQARRRRRVPGPGLLLFPFDMAPQAWPRFEAAVLVRLALQELLDNLADTTAQEQAQELPPAPAHFPFMLNDDQLQAATLVLVEGLDDGADRPIGAPGTGVKIIGDRQSTRLNSSH